MKISTLILLFVFAGLTAWSQDSVPNPGFEYWKFDTGTVSKYWNPEKWNCDNPFTQAVSIFTCTKDSVKVHSGTYSVKLTTDTVAAASRNAPAALTTGSFDLATLTVVGGIPIASKPSSLNGWYQFTPVGKDSGLAQIILISGNQIVGSGALYFTDTVSTWTYFTVPVHYTSFTMPDSVRIVFYSSGGDSANVRTNTTLWLDDLSYGAPVGITETEIQAVKLYPNPASCSVALDNQTMQAKVVTLYAADGRMVNVYILHEGINQLNISGLAAGIYTVSATGITGAPYRRMLVVE